MTAFLVHFKAKKRDTDFGVVQGDVKGYYAIINLVYQDLIDEYIDINEIGLDNLHMLIQKVNYYAKTVKFGVFQELINH